MGETISSQIQDAILKAERLYENQQNCHRLEKEYSIRIENMLNSGKIESPSKIYREMLIDAIEKEVK